MKLTVFLFFVSVFTVSANTVFSQKVTLNVENATLRDVFRSLKEQTGYMITYSEDKVDSDHATVSVNLTEVDLTDALALILADLPYTFSVTGQRVLIVPARVPAHTPDSAPIPETEEQDNRQVITGTVRDANGQPISDVTVFNITLNTGIATDIDGTYQLLVKLGDKLRFSFIGYKMLDIEVTQAILVDGYKLHVTLEENTSFINQVVVQGYGTTTVKDATGSISRLNAKEIEMSSMTSSVQSLLQGRAAGVNVQIQSASPTSPVHVLIRGVSTLTSNTQPLWVIDGVPDYSSNTSGDIANTLYNLNLPDIESLDILKDASATAIYGSRAANGVVLVTTKRGGFGTKQTIEASVKRGLQYIESGDLRTMNANEYKRFITEVGGQDILRTASVATTLAPYFDANEFNRLNTSQWDASDLKLRPDAFYNGNTNWWDEMTQIASSTQIDVSVRGGSENSNHYLSFAYNEQNGIIKGGHSELFSGRFNFETFMFNNRVKLGINSSGSIRNTDNKDNLLTMLITFRPDQPAYNEDGTINIIPSDTTVESPLLTLQNRNNGRNFVFVITPSLEWKITEQLILRTRGTINRVNTNMDLLYKKGTQGYSSTTNSRYLMNYQNTTYAWENTLDFTKTLGWHTITAMFAQSVEKYDSRYLMGYDSMFPDEEILINLGSGSDSEAESDRQQNAIASFIGRLNYKFHDRYLATVTFRTDGSSKFGPDKRWGYFPSAALAWVISEEEFIEPIRNIIPYLKLRSSIGVSGSQNLGNHDYMSLYDAGVYNGESGVRPLTLGNDKLQWEETTSFDIGLDFGLWHERIRGSVGYYSKEINNLIYNGAVPANSSLSKVNQNIGIISNKGWEFDIKVTAIKTQDIMFDLGFNIATNKGKVKKLDGIDKELIIPSYYEYVRLAEGSPVGDWYGYKWAGRQYQSQEELYGLRYRTPTTYTTSDYRNTLDYEGSLYLMDTDGDGRITGADRVVLGNFNPKFFGGFNMTFNYKNLFASAIFSYSYGAKRLWYYQYSRATQGVGVRNNYTIILDSYNFNESHSAIFPTISSSSNSLTYISDFFLHDASYFRLNTLNINYRLPRHWLKDMFITNIELSASATNLFTITKYPGFDPQGNFNTDNTSYAARDVTTVGFGEDRSLYPAARMFSLGLKVTFK